MRFHTLGTIWCYENAKNVQFENKFSEPTLALETVSLMRCTNNTSRSGPFGHVTCRNCVFEIRSSTRKITENDCRTSLNHKLDTVLESSPLLIPSVIFGGNLADGVVLKNMGGRRSETKEKLNFFCKAMSINDNL